MTFLKNLIVKSQHVEITDQRKKYSTLFGEIGGLNAKLAHMLKSSNILRTTSIFTALQLAISLPNICIS